MNEQLLKLIREKFAVRLATKTGWGRNDVMSEFDKAVAEAALQLLDEAKK